MKPFKFLIILTVILALTGCGTTATKKLPTTNVEINGVKVKAEVVKTQTDVQKGLSGREFLDEDKGMLFAFETPDRYAFWMKDVSFPLDFIWILDDKVVDLDLNVPIVTNGQKPPEYMPLSAVNYVLEVNAGFIESHGIKPGDSVKIKLDKN